MFCKSCGSPMQAGETVCSKCGGNNTNVNMTTNNQVVPNMNQNTIMNSTNTGSNTPSTNGNNKNKILIVGAIVIIVIIIVLSLFFVMRGIGSVDSKSDVTKAGENLKVENTYSVKVIGELEKHKSSNEEDLVKLKINFDRIGKDTLFYVALCDKDKKQLYYGKGHLGEYEVDETAEKYLYFYSYTSDDAKNNTVYHTDYSKMSEVKYLEISDMLQTKKWYIELE